VSTTSRIALPVALDAYLEAISRGDYDQAVRHADGQILSAMPPLDEQEETDPRRQVTGAKELRAVLPDSFGGAALTLLAAAGTDNHWLVEGRIESASAQTFVGSFTLRGDRLARQLVYRCQLVEPPPVDRPAATGNRHDARAVVDRYFDRLDKGDFSGAVACFSADVLYSHPPYSPGAGRAEFQGADELLAGFERRGVKPNRHHVLLVSPQNGPDCLIEGHTVDPPHGSSFISSFSLDEDGLIKRYLALACRPSVPVELPHQDGRH
jgi:hypothetical protein